MVELPRSIEVIWDYNLVPGDWRDSVIVPTYKNKCGRSVCDDSRSVSLLVVAGKFLVKFYLQDYYGIFPKI